MKAYWANNADPDWQMLVFAENIKEAKKLAFKHMPFACDWIDVRVWIADQKWMKFYEGSDVIYSMPDMGDETWNEWLEIFEAEHEND